MILFRWIYPWWNHYINLKEILAFICSCEFSSTGKLCWWAVPEVDFECAVAVETLSAHKQNTDSYAALAVIIIISLPGPDSQTATVPWVCLHRTGLPQSSHHAPWSAWSLEDGSTTPPPYTRKNITRTRRWASEYKWIKKGLHAYEHKWVLESMDPN